MLRLIVLLLLLANGLFFAWSQGLLLAWGFGPAQQSEPQRVQQQVRPDVVRLLPRDELRRVEVLVSEGPRSPECLQTPTLDATQIEPLRRALESWPANSWNLDAVTEPARWIVYMGKYADVEQVARKRAELRQRGISFEALASPELEPGLSLGGFNSQAEATTQLNALADRGVRTARVVQERPEHRGQRLVLPAVDDSLRARVGQLKTVLANKTLQPCR
jgi:hypothetical protein